MRLTDVPYFDKLVCDPDRFADLFARFCNYSPDSADLLSHRISKVVHQNYAVRTAVYRVYQKLRDILRGRYYKSFPNGLDTAYPIVEFGLSLGYFTGMSTDSLRSVIGELGCANDAGESATDMLIEGLNLTYCEGCEQLEYSDDMAETWDRETRCRSCISSYYVYSGYYCSYVHRDEAVSALDGHGLAIVASSQDDSFVFDEEAGRYVHENYVPPRREINLLQGYHSSKRSFRKQNDDWTAINKRFFGVELEVEMANQYSSDSERNEKLVELNDVINDGELGKKVFFERDGSLTNGFEIITQPMSLPAQKELWSFLDNKGLVRGLLSHKAPNGTCGLHVHLNRDQLSTLQIAKMVAFVNKPSNRPFMLALARRDRPGYAKYKDWKGKVGKLATFSEERYDAVNLTNRETIEFRIFKGTLKREALMAAIEFVNALAEYTSVCGECSVSDISHEAFMQFTQKRMPRETATLFAYINNRLVREAEVC